jgi:serine protease Do
MDDIIEHGRVRRAVIGVSISPVDAEDAQVAGLKEIAGVKVGGYSGAESPARDAGLQEGDIIVAADGKPTDRVSTLQRIIRGHEPGETVTVDVMRFGSKKTFRVKLAEAPSETAVATRENDNDSAAPAGGVSYDKLGVRLEAVTPEFATANRISEDHRGVRVVEINASGPARNRLFPNDIITAVLFPTPRKEVRSMADLQTVLNRAKDGDYVSLLVFDPRQNATRVANIRIGGSE